MAKILHVAKGSAYYEHKSELEVQSRVLCEIPFD